MKLFTEQWWTGGGKREGGEGRADEGNRRLEIAAGNDEMIGLHLRVKRQDRSNQVQNSDASVKIKNSNIRKLN